MPKSTQDFKADLSDWLIEDLFPMGHRGIITSPEGTFKTIIGCWFAVCIASGTPIFGHAVTQGPVLIVDGETPEESLKNHLERFAKGLGLKLVNLPIITLCGESVFKWDRKSLMNELLEMIAVVNPVFVRMDSLASFLPIGRQGLVENDSTLGGIISKDLNTIISACNRKCSILLTVHGKKPSSGFSLTDMREKNVNDIVRGHGSIVGLGCDTAFIVKVTHERPPSQFVLVPRVRRQAFTGDDMLIEIKEQRYGQGGWARLELQNIAKITPSSNAKSLFPLFTAMDKLGKHFTYKEDKITKLCAFKTKSDCREGVIELMRNKVIIGGIEVRTYTLNPTMDVDVDVDYLKMLKNSHGEVNI